MTALTISWPSRSRVGSACILLFVVASGTNPVRAFDAGTPEVLNILWRVENGADRASTISAAERDSMILDGATFYIPRYPYTGVVPFYRLLSPGGDHRDSLSTSETGYSLDTSLGYAFPAADAAVGLSQIFRGYDTSVPDTATMTGAETLPGYAKTGLAGYGWARYGTAAASLVSLSAGGVTVASNKVAGGAVWQWTWNGKQFINNGQDYGRQMQCSVSWDDSTGNTPNPTEAGDRYSVIGASAASKHGSPCVAATVSGSTMTTLSVPLEWNGGSLVGCQGGPNNPVIWKDMQIGKSLTLNYGGLGAVGKYQTAVNVPEDLDARVEIPTAYATADLTRFYRYDAATATATAVSLTAGASYAGTPPSGYGGVIVANAAGTYAMGIYGVTTAQGGSVTEFNLGNFVELDNGDTSDQAADTVKLSAVYAGTLTAGANGYSAWVMTGTLSQVKGYMNALHASGVTK